MKEVIASKKDFKWDFFRAGGKGGQRQNKVDTGVRLTHTPSNIAVECRETRSQEQNKKIAFNKIVPLVIDWWKKENGGEDLEIKKSEEIVRTYHQPDNRVIDHKSGLKQSYKKIVDKREIEDMVVSRNKACLKNESD